MPPDFPPLRDSSLNGSNHNLVIGEGVRIEGAVHAPERVEVFGTVQGDLFGGEVVIGQSGVVEGSLWARTADIHGSVSKDTEVSEAVTLRKTSRLTGELRYRSVEIEGGAKLSGTLKLLDEDVEPSVDGGLSEEAESTDAADTPGRQSLSAWDFEEEVVRENPDDVDPED